MIPRTDTEWAIHFAHDYFDIPRTEKVPLRRMFELWEELGPGMYMHPLYALRQEYFHCCLPPIRMVPAFFETGERLLDFGCGTAEFERLRWIDKGRFTVLVDMESPNFRYTRAKYEGFSVVYETDLDGIEPESVDRLLCVDVFEHVEDPMGLLEGIWAKLEPGGEALLWFDPSFPHPGHLESAIRLRPEYLKWLDSETERVMPHGGVDWVRKPRKKGFFGSFWR